MDKVIMYIPLALATFLFGFVVAEGVWSANIALATFFVVVFSAILALMAG